MIGGSPRSLNRMYRSLAGIRAVRSMVEFDDPRRSQFKFRSFASARSRALRPTPRFTPPRARISSICTARPRMCAARVPSLARTLTLTRFRRTPHACTASMDRPAYIRQNTRMERRHGMTMARGQSRVRAIHYCAHGAVRARSRASHTRYQRPSHSQSSWYTVTRACARPDYY